MGRSISRFDSPHGGKCCHRHVYAKSCRSWHTLNMLRHQPPKHVQHKQWNPKKCHGPCPIIDASSKPTCVLGAKHGCTLHPHQHSEGCVVFQSGIPQNQAFLGVWSSIPPTNLGKLEMVYGIAWGFYMFLSHDQIFTQFKFPIIRF